MVLGEKITEILDLIIGWTAFGINNFIRAQPVAADQEEFRAFFLQICISSDIFL